MTTVAEASARLPEGAALHARSAGVIVREAARHEATIVVRAGDREADATSILELLALGALGGTTLSIAAQGPDAVAATREIAALVAGLS